MNVNCSAVPVCNVGLISGYSRVSPDATSITHKVDKGIKMHMSVC